MATASSILWTLKENERCMNEELVLTRALGEKLQAKSKSLRDKKMKRPAVAEDRVEEELQRLHYKISTGSLSLKEEKNVMKEIASVKMARRDHAAVEAHREQTNQATLKADEAYAKVNRLYDALNEIRSAIRQFELCAKIEALHNNGTLVAPGDLKIKLIEVPDTSVLGQIIGRRGAGVERLRAKHCIEFDTVEEGDTTQIKLTGLPDGIEAATVAIQGILNSVSKELEVSTELIGALLHNKANRLQRFGEKHFCTVEPKRENGHIGTSLSIRGLEEHVDACMKDILSFQNSAYEVSVADELIPQVVGAKAKVLTELQEEYSVYINIDRKNLVFRIFHEDAEPKQACADTLKKLISDFTQHDDEFEINPLMASSLIGKGGETIRNLSKEAKCLVTVDRENRSRVILRGTKISLELAKEQLKKIADMYAKENQEMELSPLLVSLLINRNGNVIKELEKEHDVRINVNRETRIAVISGKEDNVINVKKTISALQESSSTEKIDGFTSSEIGEIIGKNGETIQSLTKENKCEIQIVKGDINDVIIQGLNDNVKQCKESIMNIVEKYRRENIQIKVDPKFLPSFIGKNGEAINKFREEYNGIEINLGARGSGIVKLRGEEELIQRVKKVIEKSNQLYIATHVDITILEKQMNLIIGHRGETIKQLQKDTGCFIDIHRGNSDNKARVRGETPEAVQNALHMIRNIIGTEWETRKIKLPTANAAAYVVGKKGATIQRLQKENSCVIEINRDDNHVEISGSKQNCEIVEKEIKGILADSIIYFKRIIIDEKHISSIVGRGGSNIRKIQEESGSNLNVQRPAENGETGNKKIDNRHNRDENPLDADDPNNVLNEKLFYIVVRGNISNIRKGVDMITNALADLRSDQMVLKPQHMASLKQQQSTQFVAMELRFNINIVLDMERNTVTFQQKDPKSSSTSNKSFKSFKSSQSPLQSAQQSQLLQARMQIHNLLHFFYPKEFVKVEMPSEMARQLDRDLLPKYRIQSGSRMTLVNTSSQCVILIYGDEIQCNAGVQLLKEVKDGFMKTARDVMLHSDMIPGIIGKGGSGIRALEKQFKVKISTDKKVPGLIHLRVLSGDGNNSRINAGADDTEETDEGPSTNAMKILDEVEKFFLEMKKEYEATFTSFEFDSDATSIVIGRGGATIRKLQEDHNVRIDINSNTPGVANISSDDPDNLIAAVDALKELLTENGYGEDIETSEINVQRQHVGAIVGEGGNVIQKLESDSNAQIKIIKKDDGVTVAIRGRRKAIDVAMEAIKAICSAQEEEYAKKTAKIKNDLEKERAAKQQQQKSSAQKQENEDESKASLTVATETAALARNIPGMSSEWNQQSAGGHSMSTQAQKNRRKRERRKAAAAAGKGGGKAAAKEEHYQQDLEQLLFMDDLVGSRQPVSQRTNIVSSSSWNPPPPPSNNVTRQPPPGFDSSIRSSPPPGFSPVPKNRKYGYNNEEISATMSKLADLGFSYSSGQSNNTNYANGVSDVTQKKKKYVSARGGYKLRI
jgi:polyribonucleotide nucleotidyltransferase